MEEGIWCQQQTDDDVQMKFVNYWDPCFLGTPHGPAGPFISGLFFLGKGVTVTCPIKYVSIVYNSADAHNMLQFYLRKSNDCTHLHTADT